MQLSADYKLPHTRTCMNEWMNEAIKFEVLKLEIVIQIGFKCGFLS